ncbi:MAG: MarC family protein [Deltaproteobacteria bacterium]|nr:MarC family protein [Deltaproteobacteria bacterium]
MHDLLGHMLSVFMGFFAIMNPIANTPVFLGLTASDSPALRRKVALNAISLTFLIVLFFSVFGNWIFHLFGITLPAFRLTGGLLVALIGFHMLQGEASAVHNPSDEDQADSLETALNVAVSPLAVPILAGPGTIATAMSFSADGIRELVVTIGAFAVLCGITAVFFLYGERLVSFLGQSGLNVITRLMGLILAVIGVQMAIDGIKAAFALS